jgi:hypothetical protein
MLDARVAVLEVPAGQGRQAEAGSTPPGAGL